MDQVGEPRQQCHQNPEDKEYPGEGNQVSDASEGLRRMKIEKRLLDLAIKVSFVTGEGNFGCKRSEARFKKRDEKKGSEGTERRV